MQPLSLDDEPRPTDAQPANAAVEWETSDALRNAGQWTGPRCEKCAAPLKSGSVAVCKQCGWYASLGQFIEVDQEWETDFDEPGSTQRTARAAAGLDATMPVWAWVSLATVIAVVAESIAVWWLVPAGSALRTTWSLTQLGLGVIALALGHLVAFLVAVFEDADTGMLDFVLRPLRIWMRLLARLPERAWLVDAVLAGATAAFMSVAVIGGISYERLWDWGIEPPPKQNLLGAVVSQMNKNAGAGTDSLEDSVADFAGSQDLESGAANATGAASSQDQPPAEPQPTTDCVIIGYRLDSQGKLAAVLLATAYKGKLVYAGSVSPQLSTSEASQLLPALEAAQTHRPVLSVRADAEWVEPKFSCRVSYTDRRANGRLVNPQWEKLLGQLGL